MNNLRKYFFVGVNSVQPQNLITNILAKDGENLKILDKVYPLRNTYIVGFGKAVGGMVYPIENILKTSGGTYLKQGIISVPHGYTKFAESKGILLNSSSRIQIYEGAKSNLPDKDSENAASKILNLVSNLTADDLLLVLISGGGSALLSLPIHPLNLEEKTEIIKSLSLRGASISELNTVRKVISATKGGKLASKAKCQVVSFILSDIINSPLDLIASGPTVPNTDSPDAAYTVLNKYNIMIGSNLQSALNAETQRKNDNKFNHVFNVLIGNNKTALRSIYNDIKENGECSPIIMTSSLQGEASIIGRNLARLALDILEGYGDVKSFNVNKFREVLNIEEEVIPLLINTIRKSTSLCLLFGGETTVTVNGRGRGGRNQEIVLAFSLEIEKVRINYIFWSFISE